MSSPPYRGYIPTITLVGLAATAVKESRDRVHAALVNSGFTVPVKRVTVNLQPASLPKSGTGFDLPIALALLAGLRHGGVVLAALLFGALSNGGKLMGIQSGVPFDLLFFIMALVIMFVAAPGLIRMIWRIKVSKPAPELALTQQPGATE